MRKNVSEKMKYFIKFQPSEFQRRIRGDEHFNQFKGHDLRGFLLYVGPFVLQWSIITIIYYSMELSGY